MISKQIVQMSYYKVWSSILSESFWHLHFPLLVKSCDPRGPCLANRLNIQVSQWAKPGKGSSRTRCLSTELATYNVHTSGGWQGMAFDKMWLCSRSYTVQKGSLLQVT